MNTPPFRSHWKIIACDLDGTLLGWDHKVNDHDLDALRRARAAGLHIAICTGRNSTESAGIIGALDLTGPGVFVNGAMVCDMATGKTIRGRPIPDDLVAEAVDFFGSLGHAVLGLADDAHTQMPGYFLTDHAPPHQSTTEWLLVNRMRAIVCDEIPTAYRGRIVRLGIVVDVPEKNALESALAARFRGLAESHSIYSPHYDCQVIELFAPGVTKWSGLEEVARECHATPDQIITIGDDTNDIAMLKNARLSFAMGNAREDIKPHAKRTTAPQKDCGVAQVIDQLLAHQLEP